FTFLAFFVSAVFLIQEAEEFINEELEHRFSYTTKKIRRQLRAGNYPDRLPSSAVLSEIPPKPIGELNPIYSDTLV
ncbi:MAG: hypothetical protein KAR20_12695, partial [Candidatus Heimdallarchaeota archaeon]|nr:hypothetical protein [Candidatus Heimdallarchaeota archaeon]